MQIRSKIWLPAATAALMTVAAAIWFFSSGYPFLSWFQFDTATVLEPLNADQEVVQTIKVSEDGLSRVDLRFDVITLSDDDEIIFELYEVEDRPEAGGSEAGGPPALGKKLREVRLKPARFFWMHRFSFDPVEDSGGRTYAFRVSGTSRGEPGELHLRASGADAYSEGGLYINGETTGRDLNFALFYTDGAGEIFAHIKPFRPFPLNRGAFFTAVFLTAAASFGWLLCVVARS